MARLSFITGCMVLILTTFLSVSKAQTTSSTVCTENDLGDETCVTTTTTTTSVPGTDTGNVLTNSTFGTGSTYSTDGWTIVDDHGGVVHNGTFGTTYSGQDTTGGTLAADDDMQLYQEVDLVGDGHLTKSQINEGFTSTMSADIWFWSGYEHNVQLKQTITDDNGNVTTQIRNITDTNKDWANYTDSYTQSSNTKADYSIKAEMTSTATTFVGNQHTGPDIDNIELSVLTAGTTSTSSTSTSVTTLCFDRVPNTCTYDNEALDDAVDLKTDDGKDLITVVDEDVKEAVKNFETVSVDTTVIVTDDLGEIEEVKFDEFVETQFTAFLEENNLVEDFKEELKVEGITEEQFFDELSGSMTEELGGEIMADMEEFKEEEMPNDITTETPTEDIKEETTTEEIKEEKTEEGDLNATSTTKTETTDTTETVQSNEEEDSTGQENENVSTESEVDNDKETEGQTEKESDSETVETETDVSVKNRTVDAKVSSITEKVARVIKKLEAKLKRVDDKLKATSYVLAVGLQSTQPDIGEYINKRIYNNQKSLVGVPNDEFFDKINILEQQQIYKDANLAAYTSNDPIAVNIRLLNEIEMKKLKLKAEIAALRSMQ